MVNAPPSLATIGSGGPLLVTGASGFVGWNAVRYFASRRHDVVATYRTCPHYLHDVDGVRVAQMDLLSETSVRDTIARFQPSVLLHCAALAQPQRDCDSEMLMSTNVEGTAMLAAHCGRSHIPIIYLSTDLVYPWNAGRVTMRSTVAPATAYGESKLRGEDAVRTASARWVIVRATLMYGPGTPRSRSFSQFLEQHWERNIPAPVFTDQRRSFLHVDDLVAAIETVLRSDENWNTVYLCGGPESMSRYEFALRYARLLGVDERLLSPMSTSDLPGYSGGPGTIDLDTNPLRRLGWSARTLEDAVSRPPPRPLTPCDDGNQDQRPDSA